MNELLKKIMAVISRYDGGTLEYRQLEYEIKEILNSDSIGILKRICEDFSLKSGESPQSMGKAIGDKMADLLEVERIWLYEKKPKKKVKQK